MVPLILPALRSITAHPEHFGKLSTCLSKDGEVGSQSKDDNVTISYYRCFFFILHPSSFILSCPPWIRDAPGRHFYFVLVPRPRPRPRPRSLFFVLSLISSAVAFFYFRVFRVFRGLILFCSEKPRAALITHLPILQESVSYNSFRSCLKPWRQMDFGEH